MLYLNKNLNFMKYSISISVPKDTGQSPKDTGQAPGRMGLALSLPHIMHIISEHSGLVQMDVISSVIVCSKVQEG